MNPIDLAILKLKHQDLIRDSEFNFNYFSNAIDNFNGLRNLYKEKDLTQAREALDRLYSDLEGET